MITALSPLLIIKVIPQPGEFEMRKRLCVILAAVALLTAILLPVLPSAPAIST